MLFMATLSLPMGSKKFPSSHLVSRIAVNKRIRTMAMNISPRNFLETSATALVIMKRLPSEPSSKVKSSCLTILAMLSI